MTHERKRNLVVRLDDRELRMAHALASASDVPMAQVIRRLLLAAYVEKFGVGGEDVGK